MGAVNISVPKSLNINTTHNGHWLFNKQMGDGEGFVYFVRDPILCKLYLGKKQYRVSRGKNKGAESNWKKYISSSNYLKTMFANRPKDEFDFICLEEYHTKGSLRYAETWSLCMTDALLSEDWLNGRIEEITWKVKEPVSTLHKKRLNLVLDWVDRALFL